MALEAILASAALPILTDIVKGIGGAIGRRIGGISTDDQIKLEDAGVRRLQAVAALDNPHGTPSQWVIDLRGSSRYIMAGLLIVAGGVLAILGAAAKDAGAMALGAEIAGMPFGFLYGERMVLGFRGAGAK